jgi:hypothetical protein
MPAQDEAKGGKDRGPSHMAQGKITICGETASVNPPAMRAPLTHLGQREHQRDRAANAVAACAHPTCENQAQDHAHREGLAQGELDQRQKSHKESRLIGDGHHVQDRWRRG